MVVVVTGESKGFILEKFIVQGGSKGGVGMHDSKY